MIWKLSFFIFYPPFSAFQLILYYSNRGLTCFCQWWSVMTPVLSFSIDAAVNSGEVWFVNFYFPRCSHCHDLAPTVRNSIFSFSYSVPPQHTFQNCYRYLSLFDWQVNTPHSGASLLRKWTAWFGSVPWTAVIMACCAVAKASAATPASMCSEREWWEHSVFIRMIYIIYVYIKYLIKCNHANRIQRNTMATEQNQASPNMQCSLWRAKWRNYGKVLNFIYLFSYLNQEIIKYIFRTCEVHAAQLLLSKKQKGNILSNKIYVFRCIFTCGLCPQETTMLFFIH